MAPFFNTSSPFDADVEKVTNELNTTEDWALILEICDRVQSHPTGARDCLKSIVKRLNHKIPLVAMQSLTLLDACVKNSGLPFCHEVASRDFISNCRTLINSKAHPKVAKKLKEMIKKWAEMEFKSDPSLDQIPSFYRSLKAEGAYSDNTPSPPPEKVYQTQNPDAVNSQQEEDDITKAIALSLEAGSKKTASGSLYPNFSGGATTSGPAATFHEPRKVRALYDFEAAEDNELTFKAGEIIVVIDDSDQNWWKGSNSRGEGLFPANFVTADLNTEVMAETVPDKKVQFNEEVEVKTVEAIPAIVEIDEERIDQCLMMIQNADPTGDASTDPAELLALEEQSKAMGPLIDQELEKIDRKYNDLIELNTNVLEALQMYNTLMHDLPTYGYPRPVQGPAGKMPMPPMYNMGAQQMPPQMPPQMSPQMPQMYPGQYGFTPSMPMPQGQPMPHGQPMFPGQQMPPGQHMMQSQQMMPGQQMLPGQSMPMGKDGARPEQDAAATMPSMSQVPQAGMGPPVAANTEPSNMSNNAIPSTGMASLAYAPTVSTDAYTQPAMSILPPQGAPLATQPPMQAVAPQLLM